MNERCAIYLPFCFPSGIELTQPLPLSMRVGGHLIEVGQNSPYYNLTVKEISNERAASLLLPELMAALYWAAIELGIGIQISANLQQPYYSEDPIQAAKNIFGDATTKIVECIIDGGRPAIYSEGKSLVKITGQPANFIRGFASKNLLASVAEGLALPGIDAIILRPRLKLAIDLFCLSHFQATAPARFLILCIVLEVLAPRSSAPDAVVKLIDAWVHDAYMLAQKCDEGAIEKSELLALASRVGNLKLQSHSGRIRSYIASILTADGCSDASAIARKAIHLYGMRGELMHDGALNVNGEVSHLEGTVQMILKAAMRRVGDISAN